MDLPGNYGNGNNPLNMFNGARGAYMVLEQMRQNAPHLVPAYLAHLGRYIPPFHQFAGFDNPWNPPPYEADERKRKREMGEPIPFKKWKPDPHGLRKRKRPIRRKGGKSRFKRWLYW